MGSLSHAPFTTSNTQAVASPKLLSSQLSMDPSASSSPLSSLSQVPHELSSSSSDRLNWQHLQKPNTSHPSTYTMSPFHHPNFGCNSPFYEAYSEAAGESIEHSFNGGDDPLLTSSWEALDKLVSVSMTTSTLATATDQLSDFANMQHVPHAALMSLSAPQSASPNSLSDADHKPLSAIYGSLHQKGNVWCGNHANAISSPTTTTSANNVGFNLASLISADPGFVERAAKFSSYSQQVNSQAYINSSPLQINKNSYIYPTCKSDYNVDTTRGVRRLINTNMNPIDGALSRSVSDSVALQQQYQDAMYNANAPINDSNINSNDKHASPPQASMMSLIGSKKKREGSIKDGEVDDTGGNLGRKRAKGGEQEEDHDPSDGNNKHSKMSSKVHKSKAACNEKTKQCGVANSGESQPKSESCNNNKTPLLSQSPSPSPSAPKADFIHVRARRGQATDSHSLAERVRREKISERMKYLQDLVPGCTKVTGKAMMLDEIINYVQSLQRQVEFLSMKLAAMPPSKLEFNFESLFGREAALQPTLQNNSCGASLITNPLIETPTPHPLSTSSSFLQDNMQSFQHNPAFNAESLYNPSSALHSLGTDPSLRRTLSMFAAASSDNLGECISQISDAWVDGDMQNIVPPLGGFSLESTMNLQHSLQGTLLSSQMKREL